MIHHYYKAFLIDISENPTNGASESYNLGAEPEATAPVSILCPSNLQNVDRVKFQVSRDNSTFYDILINGSIATLALVASSVINVPGAIGRSCLGWEYIRLMSTDASGTAEEPAADITLYVAFLNTVPDESGKSGEAGEEAIVSATLDGAAPVIAAAENYTAGDVLNDSVTAGNAFLIPNAARAAGLGGVIEKILITSSVEGMVPRFRLHVFDSLPTVLQDDNVALVLDEDDRSAYLGFIDMPPMQTSGSSEFSWTQLIDRFPFKCAAGATDLWFVLQTLDTFTNEVAGMTFTIQFTISQD